MDDPWFSLLTYCGVLATVGAVALVALRTGIRYGRVLEQEAGRVLEAQRHEAHVLAEAAALRAGMEAIPGLLAQRSADDPELLARTLQAAEELSTMDRAG